jgi:hypothetical protein
MENKALLRGIQNNDLASIKHQAWSSKQRIVLLLKRREMSFSEGDYTIFWHRR